MTNDHLDDALKDLRAELNVTPSPEFAAKVRERIEQAPAKSWWSGWAWAGVAATCAVAVIAVSMWRGGRPDAGDAKPATLAVASPVVSAQQPTLSPPVPVESSGARNAQSGAGSRAFRPGAPGARATVAAANVRELEVLVPPDQLIAIRRLMVAVRTGAQPTMPVAPALIDPDTGELIPAKPIEIPLITVTPLPGDPEGRSGGRENR